MKKHIFGFLLFSSIVASFALVFAFVYAPQIVDVPPYFQPQHNGISYQVQSVQFDLDRRKLISRIRLNWSGRTLPPKNLWISVAISDDQKRSAASFPAQLFREPFNNGNAVFVTLETPFSSSQDISREDNYYAEFRISDDSSAAHFSNSTLTPVLFVHGEESKIIQ